MCPLLQAHDDLYNLYNSSWRAAPQSQTGPLAPTDWGICECVSLGVCVFSHKGNSSSSSHWSRLLLAGFQCCWVLWLLQGNESSRLLIIDRVLATLTVCSLWANFLRFLHRRRTISGSRNEAATCSDGLWILFIYFFIYIWLPWYMGRWVSLTIWALPFAGDWSGCWSSQSWIINRKQTGNHYCYSDKHSAWVYNHSFMCHDSSQWHFTGCFLSWKNASQNHISSTC